ncbi:formyltetrahydrofolate-dependent phosphoribosylglycinamide formyltransferase [Melghirimyces profundicolus]|uniref:Phosphoribosylglycinamide formyltransferase n=1 Tax=Melghirimyces profundicolus TaxID=1242148 RepID=A0A2T6B3K0_9BACL|nr:phosphoribosylglycinamide formyltransferase [Melghirimyces profundicolus]PTX50631.1 formyltetrahydrofolate-dependent phosphoribosylglycinamide formyltransferase [Melghirimyces profundicolus]
MSIAVFASGNGSNFEALVERSKRQGWPEMITLLVCDRPGAGVLDRAKRLEIPSAVFQPADYASKAEYEKEVLALLRERGIRWILLAGYMRMVGSVLLEACRWRILNIHPSLLPAFQGKNAIQQALDYGVRWTGVTVHWVDEGIDTGPIIDQKPVLVEPDDNVESLQKKIQFVEHNLYPAVVRKLLTGQVSPPEGDGGGKGEQD